MHALPLQRILTWLNSNGIILKQTIRQVTAGSFDFPNPVNAGNTYNFRVYGILNGISSTACNITAVIAGPPPRGQHRYQLF